MNTQISRVRIVELINKSIEEAYQKDDDLRWINNFMEKLNQEDPTLAKAIKKVADDRLKEIDD